MKQSILSEIEEFVSTYCLLFFFNTLILCTSTVHFGFLFPLPAFLYHYQLLPGIGLHFLHFAKHFYICGLASLNSILSHRGWLSTAYCSLLRAMRKKTKQNLGIERSVFQEQFVLVTSNNFQIELLCCSFVVFSLCFFSSRLTDSLLFV